MKPQLYSYVYYTQVTDGIYFRGWGSEFVLKGRENYPFIVKLLGFFNGEISVEQLCGSLDEVRGKFVKNLVDQLHHHKMVFDASTRQPLQLDDAVRSVYAQPIAVLADRLDDANAAFNTFRQQQIVLSGSGWSLRAAARALAQLGIQHLGIHIRETSVDVEPVLTAHQQKDASFQFTISKGELALQEGQFLLIADDTLAHHPVLSGNSKVKPEGSHMIAGLFRQRGLVSPVETGESGVWQAIQERVFTPEKPGLPAAKPLLTLVGNLLAKHWFEHATGMAAANKRRWKLTTINANDLEMKSHILLPSHDRSDMESPLNLPVPTRRDPESEPNEIEALMDHIAALSDDSVGVFSDVNPGDLLQIPLPHTRLTLHYPQSTGREAKTLVNWGFTLVEAYRHLFEGALAHYAEAVSGGAGVWHAAFDKDAYHEQGLVEALWQFEQQASTVEEITQSSTADRSFNQLYRVFKLAYRAEIKVYRLQHARLPVFAALAIAGDSLRGVAYSKDGDQAVIRALGQAVSQHQAGQQTRFAEPTWQWQGRLPETIKKAQPAALPREGWYDAATAALQAQGLQLRVTPFADQPLCRQVDVHIGRFKVENGTAT